MKVNPNPDEQAFVQDIYFLIIVLCKFSYILSQSFDAVNWQ